MKQKLILIGLNVFIFTILLSAGAFAQMAGLGGRQWKLTHLNGKAVGETRAYVEFNTSEMRFNGNAGCNRMFGRYTVDNNSIKFTGTGTTRMMCSEGNVAKQEADFIKALELATRFRVSGNTLRIYAGKDMVLKFVAVYKQNGGTSGAGTARLDDKKWVLESVAGKPISKVETEAFVVFDPARASAGGNTSCNVFGGNYTTSGNTLKITETISTMRACIEDDRMTIERAFLDGLRDADRYEIKGGKLYIYAGEKLLLTFIGKAKE